MTDRIEEILKDIHVMFAKCEAYDDSTDRVIVSKMEMFELLEQLNVELDNVLDRYEATTRSREMARLDMDRERAEKVAAAKKDCDDVHAATLLYTDTMLDEVNDVVERTKLRIKHDMIEMLAELEEKQETLTQNRETVKNELTELHDNELYLKELERLRKKAEDKRKFGIEEDSREQEQEEASQPAAAGYVIKVNKPGENSGVTVSTRRSRNKAKKHPVAENRQPAEHEEGAPFSAEDFDLDGEYEQWKQEQRGETEQKASGKFKLFKKK